MNRDEAREVLAKRLAIAERRGTEVLLPQVVAKALLDEPEQGDSDGECS